MRKKTPKRSKAPGASKLQSAETYVFQLFVTGALPNSARAIINCKEICEKYLKGQYQLEIIDIYQQPSLAVAEQIIAVPVLIKKFPLPEERLVGDMSDLSKVLAALHLS